MGRNGSQKTGRVKWLRSERWTVSGWVVFFFSAILFGFFSAARLDNAFELARPGMAAGVLCWGIGLVIGVADLARGQRREAALMAVLGGALPMAVLMAVAWLLGRGG